MYSRAYWVTKTIIAWNVDVVEGSCYLYASKVAALSVTDNGIQGHDLEIKLEEDRSGLPPNHKENAEMLPVCSYLVFWMNCSHMMVPLVLFILQKQCLYASGLPLPKQFMLTSIRIQWVGVPWKLSRWRKLMVFGVLKDQKVGKAVTTCMKYLSTIQARCILKNVMQMIHMQEGMLVLSISQQFFWNSYGFQQMESELYLLIFMLMI